MTGSSGAQLSKGLRMIAAYRAERLSQRPAPRGALQRSDVDRQATRGELAPEAPAACAPAIDAMEEIAERRTAEHASGSATLVSAGAERYEEAAPPSVTDASAPAAAAPAADDPPLAEIGFGPGMLIRLSQLGVNTTADLARTDAERLRAELGEISRLVDVEAWIRHARQTTGLGG